MRNYENTIRKLLQNVKNCLFPIYCLGCNQEGEWLCENCLKQIDPNGVFCCPVCNQNNGTGLCCRNCRNNSFLEQVISVMPYHEDKLIGKIIEHFKYHYVEELKAEIEIMIKNFLEKHFYLFSEIKTIVPVPLHSRRYAERGFNQAEVIAKIIARELNKPALMALQRGRYTRQQAKLNRAERRANIHDAFQSKDNVSGKVLLVDDVYTTGATMQECARVLKQLSTVKEVIGFTLARG